MKKQKNLKQNKIFFFSKEMKHSNPINIPSSNNKNDYNALLNTPEQQLEQQQQQQQDLEYNIEQITLLFNQNTIIESQCKQFQPEQEQQQQQQQQSNIQISYDSDESTLEQISLLPQQHIQSQQRQKICIVSIAIILSLLLLLTAIVLGYWILTIL